MSHELEGECFAKDAAKMLAQSSAEPVELAMLVLDNDFPERGRIAAAGRLVQMVGAPANGWDDPQI